MRFETGGAFIAGLALSACAVVGPLYDQRMGEAPIEACVDVQAVAEGAGSGAPQCFALAEMDAQGNRSAWSGGAVSPGRTLIAVYRPGPGCLGRQEADLRTDARMFSHLTITGSSDAAGRAELATWDLHARPGQSRTLRWQEPFQGRSYALADIGSVLMTPAGARISVSEGSFEPSRLCFKSY